ncbi:MAG: hypothetical protein KKH98_03550, partial [Spirochaetes bacterium]|nr:hypothetical protein [Spirochaetota bacterium]
MKTKNLTSLLIVVSCLIFLLSGCGKKEKIDFGSIENDIFKHDYFGFTLQIPEDAHVQDNQAKKDLMKQGGEILAGDDKNMKAVLDASALNTLNLVTFFKYEPGSPVDYNPGFIAVAEKVSHLPGIKNGSDYLFHAKKLMESSQLQYIFGKEVYTENIGGVEFNVMELSIDVNGTLVKQK